MNKDNLFKTATKNAVNYKQFGLIITLVVILILAAIITPTLFAFNSFSAMLSNNAVYVILAIGVSFVLITGGIDISIGSILAVSGVSATRLMLLFPQVPAILWLLVGVLIGAICGFINGFLIGKFKADSLIITLATMYVFRGVSFLISNGEWVMPDSFTYDFQALAQTEILGFKSIVWWALGVVIVVGVFMGLKKFGRRFYAVGSSEESSMVTGINIVNVKITAFVLCGMFSGLAGVLFAANYAEVSYYIGTGYEMTAIAICVLGGVSITGGSGRIDGIVIGYLIIAIATYMLSLISGFSVWQDFLQGLIIIVALAINLTNRRITEARSLVRRGAK